MAFRRKRSSFRRARRARWDMQTYRECSRQFNIDVSNETAGTCNDPQIFADLLCGPVSSTGSVQQIAGASRAMMYGGGHLQIRYSVALVNQEEMPCSFEGKVITALCVLPLLEDDSTPAYLPNLAVARTQFSVLPATQSDTDENILYWRDSQLYFFNEACSNEIDETTCIPSRVGDCTLDTVETSALMHSWRPTLAALHYRDEYYERIRVKRRLKEREGLFLLSEWVIGSINASNFAWPIQRNVYHRYAVRPSR